MKEIPLTQGKTTVVDDSDYPSVEGLGWYALRKKSLWYAVRQIQKFDGGWTLEYLHRRILGLTKKTEITDHRDGNGLNNRRYNLRVTSTAGNSRAFQTKRVGTSSRFRGVTFVPRRNKWQASIKILGRSFWLGYFESEVSAAAAYLKRQENLTNSFTELE